MTIKELRMKRIRHGITAKEMAEQLGVSYGWFRTRELYYRGPSTSAWENRYEAALRKLIKPRCSHKDGNVGVIKGVK